MHMRRRIKNTVKHHSNFQLAKMESQDDRAGKALKRPHVAQLTDEWVLPCTHRSSIRSYVALFKPGTDI